MFFVYACCLGAVGIRKAGVLTDIFPPDSIHLAVVARVLAYKTYCPPAKLPWLWSRFWWQTAMKSLSNGNTTILCKGTHWENVTASRDSQPTATTTISCNNTLWPLCPLISQSHCALKCIRFNFETLACCPKRSDGVTIFKKKSIPHTSIFISTRSIRYRKCCQSASSTKPPSSDLVLLIQTSPVVSTLWKRHILFLAHTGLYAPSLSIPVGKPFNVSSEWGPKTMFWRVMIGTRGRFSWNSTPS